jgi:hypothetical protein
MKSFLLYSKKVRYAVHILAFVFTIVWFFPNLFTHRDIPRWPVLMNATLEGIDSNNNNLRDDVEIRLHYKIDDDGDYLKSIAYAAAIERRLKIKAETRTQALEILRNESCNEPKNEFYIRNSMDQDFPSPLIFNTQKRIDKAGQNVIFVTRSGDLREYECGSIFDLSEKYKLVNDKAVK